MSYFFLKGHHKTSYLSLLNLDCWKMQGNPICCRYTSLPLPFPPTFPPSNLGTNASGSRGEGSQLEERAQGMCWPRKPHWGLHGPHKSCTWHSVSARMGNTRKVFIEWVKTTPGVWLWARVLFPQTNTGNQDLMVSLTSAHLACGQEQLGKLVPLKAFLAVGSAISWGIFMRLEVFLFWKT